MQDAGRGRGGSTKQYLRSRSSASTVLLGRQICNIVAQLPHQGMMPKGRAQVYVGGRVHLTARLDKDILALPGHDSRGADLLRSGCPAAEGRQNRNVTIHGRCREPRHSNCPRYATMTDPVQEICQPRNR